MLGKPRISSLFLQHSGDKHVFSIRVENSVDPDQKPADLELHCFQKRINRGSAGHFITV